MQVDQEGMPDGVDRLKDPLLGHEAVYLVTHDYVHFFEDLDGHQVFTLLVFSHDDLCVVCVCVCVYVCVCVCVCVCMCVTYM